jgi:FdrA protein
MDAVRQMLAGNTAKAVSAREKQISRLEQAAAADDTLNFVLISVAGDFAKYEAAKAISRGMNVMLYSDNISVADELMLKQAASRRGLIVMGPDCGTAMIDGVPLGFANHVRRGNIGIVGASGTGIQEVMSLVDLNGAGISHAIGTGGRDLKDEIGGITMLAGLNLLKDDPGTAVITVISKPPGGAVREKLSDAFKLIGKPVIVYFAGCDDYSIEEAAGAIPAHSLEQAALLAVKAQGIGAGRETITGQAAQAVPACGSGKYLRGIFGGGSLCYEAMHIAASRLEAGAEIFSNTPWGKIKKMTNVQISTRHSFVDMGDDEFTVGKPHPMIDPTEKNKRLLREMCDPEVAVVLFDLVIGYGSHSDPAGEVVKSIETARGLNKGRPVALVASVCGTDADRPSRGDQIAKLTGAGVAVLPSNARAAEFAVQLIQQKKEA